MEIEEINLTPEEKLLISLCRMRFTEAETARIRDLAEKVTDWDKFTVMANSHGVIALMRNNLRKLELTRYIPEKNLNVIESAFLISLSRNTYIFQLFREIAVTASEENIRIVPLKGLLLEKSIYGNAGLRQMNDLDILVSESDARKLRDALIRKGFDPDPFISSIYEKHLFYEGKHLPELHKAGLSVEIHTRIFSQASEYLSQRFLETTTMSDGAENISVSWPALNFLYLVWHLNKHESEGSSQLRLYTDLIVLLEENANGIVNRQLFDFASKAGLKEVLNLKLNILRSFWNIKIEGDVIPTLEEGQTETEINRFVEFLRKPESDKPRENPGILPVLRNISGVRKKVLFITGYLFPSVKYLRHIYHTEMIKNPVFCYLKWWSGIFRRLWKSIF